LLDDQRSQRDIPGAHQIGMQPVVALLADKEQTMLRPVGSARVSTPRTGLAGVVSIHLDAPAACQGGLVHEQLLQFRKGPFARVSIGTTGLPGHGDQLFPLAAAPAAPGALSDACQRFQPYKGLRMGRQDAFAQCVVGIQLEPSLSLAQRDSTTRGRPRAFALKSFLKAGVMVRFRAYLLS
jgi:hypothetical protein